MNEVRQGRRGRVRVGLCGTVRGGSWVCLGALAVLWLLATTAQAMTLVKDGQPAATIVVSEAALKAEPIKLGAWEVGTPEQKVRLAAEDLQRYIEKISGAKLPTVDDAQDVKGAVILVGASRKTEPLKLNIPSGLTNERREEGYLIVCKGDVLALAGNDAGPYYGTCYAVAEFLNRLGVRWFMPSEYGEVVPKRATIECAPLDWRDKPDFALRSWWGNISADMFPQEFLYKLRNKMHPTGQGVLAVAGDSSLRNYLPDKEHLQTHPEYFARNLDGSTFEFMPNLSHPDVPKLVAEKMKAALKKTQEQSGVLPNSIGIAPDDGIPMDLTKETMATNLGFPELVGRENVISEVSVSEEWFRFMNKVAEQVAKDYPNVIIATNGYANRNTPPEGVTLHPNLAVMFAAIWSDTLHAYDDPKSWQAVLQGQMLRRWCELSKRVTIYNYNETMLVTCLTPVPLTRKLARNFPLMKKWGVMGFNDEANFAYMSHGITTYYIRARLMWDADLDVPAALKDFFEKWYGPAAAPAQAFWDAIEEAIEGTRLLGHEDRVLPYVYTPELIAKLEKAEADAEQAAKAEPYATHVRADRLILEHLKGYTAMHAAEFDGNFKEAARQADAMFKQRVELNRINPFYHVPESKDPRLVYFSGAWYWTLTDRKAFYEKLAAMTSGETGELIAMAPKQVKFSLDDADLGRFERWHDPEFDRGHWRTLDTTIPFYLQGYMDERGIPYRGLMWYVFELDVPRSAIGKKIHLYSPVVTDEAWVWVNGSYIGRRPYTESYIRPAVMEFDATGAIKAGKNVIGVRVSTSPNRTQVAEGFQGRLFLYSPK